MRSVYFTEKKTGVKALLMMKGVKQGNGWLFPFIYRRYRLPI